ncbi:MAG: carboxypeptidase-like regulatory domain-containing protein [Phaeodactylibacter sp.]|uniref:carboxypeptidase-like regulatory domain-containing protein n=1 Tax=Phaeodactylibacter sp. TaxID=1940289 RepID=UPI0032EDD96C
MRYLALLMLFPIYLTAQQSGYVVLQGRVLNAKTGEPLSHAHIGIPQRGIGTTSGYDGQFTLKVPDYYRNSDLQISYLGFLNYTKPITEIAGRLTARLQPSPSVLQEIVVMDEQKVEDLIRKAVRRIPDNYPDFPTSLTGFYRESKTNAEQTYVYLAEGVLNLYKRSYQNDKEGQVSLAQGRKVVLVPEEELRSTTGFSSGHLAADRFDFVKNREDFLEEDNFEAYKYWISSITTHNDRPVYVISFDREDNDKRARMKGELYLDTLSFAIVRASFEILPDAQRKYNDYPLYTGNWKGNRYFVNYREVDGRWHLSEALREGTWKDGGIYTNELIVTEVKPGRGKVIPYMERLGRDDRFLDRTGTYDEDFWAAYNTAPINDERLAETVRQLNNQNKATEVFDTTFINTLRRQQDSIAQVQSTTQPTADSFDISYVPAIPRAVSGASNWDFYFSYGAGTHFLSTASAQYQLGYYDTPEGPAILEVDEMLEAREIEPVYQWALGVTYRDRYLLRWTLSRDLWNSIYRESAIGGGLQFNLTKKYRPLYIRPMVQFSRLLYGRKVGEADNDFGRFEADDKKFKANKVNMYLGDRIYSWKLSLEMAIELNPSRELFLRADYLMPYSQSERVFLRERGRFFPRRAELATDGSRVRAFREGVEMFGPIAGTLPTYSLTVGIMIK